MLCLDVEVVTNLNGELAWMDDGVDVNIKIQSSWQILVRIQTWNCSDTKFQW
jgi:hypothetical protein